MRTVFLSYCTRDHFFAELARFKLQEAEISVWIDKGELRAGDDWRQEIDRGISDSFAVILALSSDSAQSSYVTYEWASAMGKKKPIVPVLLNSCERHPRLEPLQYIDFSNVTYQPWAQLIARIEEIEKDAETLESDDDIIMIQESDTDQYKVGPPTEEDEAVEKILAYLNQRGYQMVSFERIRRRISESYTDQFLYDVIKTHRNIFRSAKLKGGKTGMAKL